MSQTPSYPRSTATFFRQSRFYPIINVFAVTDSLMAEKTSSDIPVDRKKVVSAVKAVKALYAQHIEKNAKKKPLLSEVEGASLLLQVSLKKIPYLKNISMIKIPLPHSLVTETNEVCLFTGDLDKSDRKADIEPTVLHYKELLRRHGVKSISEVIPLRQLRTDYKPHEAKRQLMAGYDFFLAEEKIAGCLPRVLGKNFFKKRKFPLQVNLSRDVEGTIERALSNTVLYLTGRGNTSCFNVAHLDWKVKKIANNVMAAVNALPDKIPGGLCNIDGLYLKTERSQALPIYVSLESKNAVRLPKTKQDVKIEPEDITTVSTANVIVYPDGRVNLVPKKECDLSDDEGMNKYKRLAAQDESIKRIQRSKKIRKS